jgi:hypothetical protein
LDKSESATCFSFSVKRPNRVTIQNVKKKKLARFRWVIISDIYQASFISTFVLYIKLDSSVILSWAILEKKRLILENWILFTSELDRGKNNPCFIYLFFSIAARKS